MKIAVAILNWNGLDLLKKYCDSVVQFSHTDATIYLIDNASSDSSVSYVTTHFPQIKIIQHSKNYGFSEGYNLAIQHIEEPIICLLNSDIRVTKDWLKPFFTLFDDSRVAIAQPKILDDKNTSYFEYAGAAGGYIDTLGYPYCRGRIFDTVEEDKGQYNDRRPIFWASGAAFFIRKSVYEELGGLDTTYFAHHEEIDICWRALNQGYKVMYEPLSTVYHLGGATLDTQNPSKTFLNFRNSLFNLLKNLPLFKAIIIIFIRLLLDAIAGLQFIIQGKWKHCMAIIKAHFSFYYYAPKIFYKRSKITCQPEFKPQSIVFLYYIKKIKTFKNIPNIN